MDIKNLIYEKKNKIGLKDNISFKEILELEKFIEELSPSNNLNKDIKILLNTSIEMKSLLEECRKNKLPFKLAEKIDNILNKINHL